jgi:serine/threonine protein phosphatase PrpC
VCGYVQLGHHISQAVRDLVALELHALVTEALNMRVKVDWPAALSKAYLLADAKVLQLKGQQKVSQSRVLDSRHAGTTGTTVVLDGLHLHIASVGDSRVILGKVCAHSHTQPVSSSARATPCVFFPVMQTMHEFRATLVKCEVDAD